jgi:ubiquinone/menaquinone biosynthesis C-methylase UbiE
MENSSKKKNYLKTMNSIIEYIEFAILINPLRRVFQNPEKILKEIGLRDAMHVIDLGCGPGYLTIPAAKIVGPSGRVYAVDVNERYLRYVRKKMEEHGLDNIILLNTEAWRLDAIPPNTVDICLMFLSLHHFSKKRESIYEVIEKLKKGGTLVIYDTNYDVLAGHGTHLEEIQATALEAGFITAYLRRKLTTYMLKLLKP